MRSDTLLFILLAIFGMSLSYNQGFIDGSWKQLERRKQDLEDLERVIKKLQRQRDEILERLKARPVDVPWPAWHVENLI